jgi:hypothetical protein
MEDETINSDFYVSPELFESIFCGLDPPKNLSDMALNSQLPALHNRFICWRVFLGFFPESGPIEIWVDRVSELRNRYHDLVTSQTVFIK